MERLIKYALLSLFSIVGIALIICSFEVTGTILYALFKEEQTMWAFHFLHTTLIVSALAALAYGWYNEAARRSLRALIMSATIPTLWVVSYFWSH